MTRKTRRTETRAIALRPWREVVTPHEDVASGDYSQAEFAADLWQVHLGEASGEYQEPVEFFQRTYLTAGLARLLANAARRLAGQGGDPVVSLQTGFGGGKTHTLLALYHLCSGASPAQWPNVERILSAEGMTALPRVRRVVLVGNKISPGNPLRKSDGTIVRTLWGELAWQLGGRAAFERVALDDECGTSPGDKLRELMNEFGPCLILIDEWVAYARQLHDTPDLPGGTLATHVSFAQALTESAKLARQCMLVISLPAAIPPGESSTSAAEVEVGGERGRIALERLRAAIGRVEASWTPADRDEQCAIACHRLVKPLTQPARRIQRDEVVSAFGELYRTHREVFPAECSETDYLGRFEAAYPFHPELFDRLFSDWSNVGSFQGTRGVLRLLAGVVCRLWQGGDPAPLILPGTIPLEDSSLRFEVTRYLPESWELVLDQDVDGPHACSTRLDGEVPILGKLSACRRVARAIFLGSAPSLAAADRGVDSRRIHLGCVLPGESPAVFDDALRRIGMTAAFLYRDSVRWWFAPQPTVTRMGMDRAEQLRHEPERVQGEIESRLRRDVQATGDFHGVCLFPESGSDVPDTPEARLVVLPIGRPHDKRVANSAQCAAEMILESCGGAPRRFRNSLVFLAADSARLRDLDDSVRRCLAWESILADRVVLALSPSQTTQAEAQRAAADHAVTAQLPEAFNWLLVPTQAAPGAPIQWRVFRLSEHGALAPRAAKKLRAEELLVTALAGTRLRMELDRVPLWRGEHVTVRQLVEDFASCLYLPRLSDPRVLWHAIRDGVGLLTWASDGLALADGWDEATHTYRGLRIGKTMPPGEPDPEAVVVRPELAQRQRGQDPPVQGAHSPPKHVQPLLAREDLPKGDSEASRFVATIALEPGRAGRAMALIDDEIIGQLAAVEGAQVKITVEIEADLPRGVPSAVVRAVTENCRTLKITDQRFDSK